MRRRTFLAGAAGTAGAAFAQQSAIPVIDTHIHLFDTARPGGVPWPQKDIKPVNYFQEMGALLNAGARVYPDGRVEYGY